MHGSSFICRELVNSIATLKEILEGFFFLEVNNSAEKKEWGKKRKDKYVE